MSELTFSNVVIYAIQILAVVAMAAAVARVVPMPLPAGRLLYWRTVVVAGLVLPLGTLLLRGIAARRVTGFALTVDAVTSAASTDIAGIPILQVVAAVFVLGAVLRILWLAVGLARMARLRAGASPARLDPAVEALRQEIAPYAVVARHDAVLQPITFGLRHPIVLVPDTFESLPAEIQRAVVCHELLHVKRHDWAWTLIEEGIRSLFWCHPGMRWAVSKIQASREEVVDAAAIARTGARREYMTALLSFAGVPAFRPAIPFVRHHHVGTRIRRIAEEVQMSRARLISAGVLAVGLVVLGAVGAASWLPLHAAQATRLRAGGAIKPPTKIHDVRPVYPDDAQAAGVEGVVIQQIVISTEGAVIETSLLRSVPMLDDAARNAVLQWRFEPTLLNGEPVEIEMVVTVNFSLSK